MHAKVIKTSQFAMYLNNINIIRTSAQRIKSVEVCNLGSSVVAGLVPATNPWYGIFPTHQRD
jgi:hypothetical protein